MKHSEKTSVCPTAATLMDKDQKFVPTSINIIERYSKLNSFQIDVERLVKQYSNDADLGRELRSLLNTYLKFTPQK